MDDDIFDGDQSSDSDAVDEDLEHQLYGAIFFGGNFLPSKEVEERPNVIPKDSSGSLLVNCPLASELVTLENQAVSTETLPSSDILIDLTRDSTNKIPVDENMNNENETVVQELVGSVVVSSFKDHSDSDESFKQHYPGADVGADSPSTDYITEESECESICSISVGNSKLLCSTPRNFSAPNHDPGSIVLGVSREGSSIVCNADDSVVIAQLLETSSKDPPSIE
ncbi:hypothetical protein FGIG_12561 [Fasciola gigantica]|uniref:Uncharacterized protein n=1 Tax=Fasciola gigantica TaxID=46835 RepID=A0A504YKQ1_FASGI|nr:hypothetical protein FGIG_12561 [Fasciola gigantica]